MTDRIEPEEIARLRELEAELGRAALKLNVTPFAKDLYLRAAQAVAGNLAAAEREARLREQNAALREQVPTSARDAKSSLVEQSASPLRPLRRRKGEPRSERGGDYRARGA